MTVMFFGSFVTFVETLTDSGHIFLLLCNYSYPSHIYTVTQKNISSLFVNGTDNLQSF